MLIIGSTLGPALSIAASVQIANNNTRSMLVERERAKEAARAESHRLVCAFFSAQLDAYDETPPTTPAGKNLRQTNLEFYNSSECQPPRR